MFSEEETKCLESQIERFEGENEKLKTHMYHLIVNGIYGLSPDWVGGKIPLNKKKPGITTFWGGNFKSSLQLYRDGYSSEMSPHGRSLRDGFFIPLPHARPNTNIRYKSHHRSY